MLYIFYLTLVLSVTILETTKTQALGYRSEIGFIGHNFGDYKNSTMNKGLTTQVLSVTILETTKTFRNFDNTRKQFYRSQFWRLQKPQMVSANYTIRVRSYSA